MKTSKIMDKKYEKRELEKVYDTLEYVELTPKHLRDAYAHEWAFAILHEPTRVAMRIGWLIYGNFGYGALLLAKDIMSRSKRCNKKAALSILVAALEWHVPSQYARNAWNKLSDKEKQLLDKEIEVVIQEYQK